MNRFEIMKKGYLGRELECGCTLEYNGKRCKEAKQLWKEYMELNPNPPKLNKFQAKALEKFEKHFDEGIKNCGDQNGN